jgi:hypothetical protein
LLDKEQGRSGENVESTHDYSTMPLHESFFFDA